MDLLRHTLVRAYRSRQHRRAEELKARTLLSEDAAGFRTHPAFGLAVAVDHAVVAPTILNEISSGYYEVREATLFSSLVQPEDSVLELGAGLGFVTARIMTACRPQAYCAVEADARLLPIIRRTLELNNAQGNLKTLNAILTEDPQKLQNGSAPFLIEEEFFVSRECSVDNNILVPTLSLNAVLRSRSVSVLIADIEGGEATLFDGADLSGLRAVGLELHPQHIGHEGVRKLFGLLHERGLIYDSSSSSFAVVTFKRPSPI